MEKPARPRFVLNLLAAVAVTGTGTALPAQAQMLSPASSKGLTKAEAILGGAPSRLASILAAQASSTPIPASSFAAAAPIAFPAVARAAADYAPVDLTASPERPDVFNSVAMPISASPLDHRWNQVSRGAVGGRAGAFAATLRGKVERARIEAVNAYVNARVAFVADSRQYGVADRWSAASETLARGRGDCEDFALAKMAMLRGAGFADKDLYMVVLKDLVRRADHAVLVVRSEGRFMVLDNGTDRLLDSALIDEYRPVLTFSAGQRFAHGYRRNTFAAPVVMAGASPAVAPTIAMAASVAGLPWSPFPSR
jgi:predicted transglutaminase-like cysteine proteinase